MFNTNKCSIPRQQLPEVAMFSKKISAYRQHFPYYFEEITGQSGSTISVGGVEKLNFCTYSYLGLFDHSDVKRGAHKALLKYGCGTHGVRLLGGNLSLYNELERRIARFCRRESAMLFTSGFLTNQTVIRALVRPGDVIFCEKRSHASIIDGCRLANAEVIEFNHDDPAALEQLMTEQPDTRRKLIVADAVFSMEGDVLDLPVYLDIRDRYPNTFLMVDEAHSLGVLGKDGAGIESQFDIDPQAGIDIKMGTLSKAIPGNGGYIAADADLIAYLRYHARGYIFTAALAPTTAGAALASIDVLEKEGPERIERLWRNVRYLRQRLADYSIPTTASRSPITGVLIGNERQAFTIAGMCIDQGVFVLPVAHPAVPRGSERIRLNVHCDHRFSEIDHAVDILSQAINATKGASLDQRNQRGQPQQGQTGQLQ